MRGQGNTRHGRRTARLAAVGGVLGLLTVIAWSIAAPQPSHALDAQVVTVMGGVDLADAPPVMLNDQTVYGVRWAASGLATNTTYYVKVRISPVADGRGQDRNRGFTWNKSTGRWVHERDSWLLMPQVQTDATGATIGDEWLYCKFSDEATSGARYIVVSVSKTGSASTINLPTSSPVQVIDARTQGAWFHPYTTTGINTAKRIDATTSVSTILAMSKAETNTVDDDCDGTADNENWCYLNGSPLKSFRLGVPINTLFTVRSQKTTYFPAWGVDRQITVPDTEIALGAPDEVAPTAAAGLTATGNYDGSVALSWTAATDNTALYGYNVYRWNDPVPIDTLLGIYTPDHVKVGQVAAGTTTFSDTTAPRGKTAYYEIRAVDTASNVGPRSNTAQASVAATPAVVNVYRFYRKASGTHFYTSSEAEKNFVLGTLGNHYTLEGVAYPLNTASAGNTVPLHRFYNMRNGTHFYTANDAERAWVVATLSHIYRYEGIAYYVSADPAGTPVHRFYGTRSGAHFYTSSAAEKAWVESMLGWAYRYEGIAWYIAP